MSISRAHPSGTRPESFSFQFPTSSFLEQLFADAPHLVARFHVCDERLADARQIVALLALARLAQTVVEGRQLAIVGGELGERLLEAGGGGAGRLVHDLLAALGVDAQ